MSKNTNNDAEVKIWHLVCKQMSEHMTILVNGGGEGGGILMQTSNCMIYGICIYALIHLFNAHECSLTIHAQFPAGKSETTLLNLF